MNTSDFSHRKLIYLLIILSFILSPATNAQINLKGKVQNAINNRVDKEVNNAVDNALNNDDNNDKDTSGENTQQENASTNSESSDDNTSESAPHQQQPISMQSYSKYDFIPGEKVIFFDDFSQDAIGDFPALWNTNGSAEVVTTDLYPGKWMKFNCYEAIWTDQLLKLPDNYTIEFDVVPIKNSEGAIGYNFRLIQSENPNSIDYGAIPGKAGFLFNCYPEIGSPNYRAYVNRENGDESTDISGYKEDEQYYQKENQKYHIAIWVQKSRLRLYLEQNKIFDLPKAFPFADVKMDRIRFEEGAGLISNVRIAVGSPDLRNKLLTEGKLVSYGIYFEVNKDVVKPESNGTLKEIAAVLKENPDVRIKIIGHTDADGADAANLDLSKRRGASVKNELVKTFGIDASRIETDGLGETQPVAPNDTPANKALNRRVEFIKL